MGLRTHNPTTPGSRGRVSPDFSDLTKGNEPVSGHAVGPPRGNRAGIGGVARE